MTGRELADWTLDQKYYLNIPLINIPLINIHSQFSHGIIQ